MPDPNESPASSGAQPYGFGPVAPDPNRPVGQEFGPVVPPAAGADFGGGAEQSQAAPPTATNADEQMPVPTGEPSPVIKAALDQLPKDTPPLTGQADSERLPNETPPLPSPDQVQTIQSTHFDKMPGEAGSAPEQPSQ